MTDTIENDNALAHVRLGVPATNHARAHRLKRLLQVQKNEDVTVIQVYLKAIEIGLKELEKTAA